MQNLPKSLHTVKVLARVARAIRPMHPHATPEGLIGLGLLALGYVEFTDDYGLRAAALKQL